MSWRSLGSSLSSKSSATAQQLPSRAVERHRRWSVLTDAEKDRVHTIAIAIKQSGLIMDRTHRLRTYKSVFVGTEVVTWMVSKQLAADRAEACELGQMLVAGNFVHHVSDKHEFQDQPYFYRFRFDEKTAEGPSVMNLLADTIMEGWLTIKKHRPSMRAKRMYCLLTTHGASHILYQFASDVATKVSGHIKFEQTRATIRHVGNPTAGKYSFQLSVTDANGDTVLLTATAPTWTQLERWIEMFVQIGATYLEDQHPSAVFSSSIHLFTCYNIAHRPVCLDQFRNKVRTGFFGLFSFFYILLLHFFPSFLPFL